MTHWTWTLLLALAALVGFYFNLRPYSIDGMRLKWRLEARRNKASPHGEPAVAFGIRIGYWPCKHAPFLQIAVLFWRIDLWHGLASATQIARGE